MPDAYVIEVSGRTAGIVARDGARKRRMTPLFLRFIERDSRCDGCPPGEGTGGCDGAP